MYDPYYTSLTHFHGLDTFPSVDLLAMSTRLLDAETGFFEWHGQPRLWSQSTSCANWGVCGTVTRWRRPAAPAWGTTTLRSAFGPACEADAGRRALFAPAPARALPGAYALAGRRPPGRSFWT